MSTTEKNMKSNSKWSLDDDDTWTVAAKYAAKSREDQGLPKHLSPAQLTKIGTLLR